MMVCALSAVLSVTHADEKPNFAEGIYCTGLPVGLSDITVLVSKAHANQPRQMTVMNRAEKAPARRARKSAVRCANTPNGFECGFGEVFGLKLNIHPKKRKKGYYAFDASLRGLSRYDETLNCLVKADGVT